MVGTDELTHLPVLDAMARSYQGLSLQPCRVTALLRDNAPVCAYDPIHLDNLLARSLVDEATGCAGLVTAQRPYDLPCPLHCLWRDPWGLPLWASTVFTPEPDHVADTIYSHKRAQSGRFTKTKSGRFSVVTKSGRYMERRIPTPVTISHRWSAFCVGDIVEITRLLQSISFLGKKRAVGWGEVREWRVDPLPLPEDFDAACILTHEGLLTRPVPIGAAAALGLFLSGSASLVGWTPPQWLPSAFQAGWRTGTPVSV